MVETASNADAIGIERFPPGGKVLGLYCTPTGTTLIELRGLPSMMRSV